MQTFVWSSVQQLVSSGSSFCGWDEELAWVGKVERKRRMNFWLVPCNESESVALETLKRALEGRDSRCRV